MIREIKHNRFFFHKLLRMATLNMKFHFYVESLAVFNKKYE